MNARRHDHHAPHALDGHHRPGLDDHHDGAALDADDRHDGHRLDDHHALPPPLRWMGTATPRTRYGTRWLERAGHLRTRLLDDWHAANAEASADVQRLPVVVEDLRRGGTFDRVRPSVWTCRVRIGPLALDGVAYRVDWAAPLAHARRLTLPPWLSERAALDGLPGGLAVRRAVADAVRRAVLHDVDAHAPPDWPRP